LGLSQGRCLFDYAIPDTCLESALGHNINLTTQYLSELHHQSTHVEQVSSRVHIDQEVHIAVRARFTTNYRAENPDVVGTMSCGDLQDFLSPAFYEFFNSHDFERFYAIRPQLPIIVSPPASQARLINLPLGIDDELRPNWLQPALFKL
jgi:hypothetical protein